MKNKPIRHKEDNTFKFQPFAERISNIDVDIFHRVPHAYETETEEIESFFYQTLQKWNVLNLTEGYDALRKEVHGVITLPQLLHKKDHVVEALLKHLKEKNALSLQPILELIISLSKDLQKEFYAYYSSFLYQLIELLNTKDTDVLEWTFVCLAYLFKNLWRYIIKDINVVFVNLLPLLSNKKPEYINNFAAESFAFVARKVKDRQSFLSLILSTVKTEKDGITGCGKLLFEVIHGVQNNFHSCAEQTLQFYFESLSNEDLPQDILFEVLQEVVKNITHNIKPKNIELHWKSLFTVIDKNIGQVKNEKFSINIELLLKLVYQTLSYKEGRMLGSTEQLVKLYLKIIQIENLPENNLLIVSKIGSTLLVSQNIQLAQEHASSLIRKSLVVPNKIFMLDFVTNLTNYSSFEVLVLPAFLNYYKNNLNDESLRYLAEIVMKKSILCYNGIKFSNWIKYPLEFSNMNGKILDNLCSYLKKITTTGLNDLNANFENYIFALICVPHINAKIDSKIVEDAIQSILVQIEKKNLVQNEQSKAMFLLANLLTCLACVVEPETLYKFCEKEKLMQYLLEQTNDSDHTVMVLSMVDLILTACQSTPIISMDTLVLFNEKTAKLFSSPIKKVRLLICHIFTLFESLPELIQNSSLEKIEEWKVFSLCYNTESIDSTVQTYRDQIQNLQKLAYDKSQGILCKDSDFSTIPLRYLLGVLYVNFQLLWDPIMNIITTYAHGMPVAAFWEVFLEQLKYCADEINNPGTEDNLITLENVSLNDFYIDSYKNNCSIDFVHYRQLLWKTMCEFPEIVEAKNRDVTPLMLSFIENEYRSSNISEALIWNIKQNTPEVDKDDDEENEDKEEETEEKDDEMDEEDNEKSMSRKEHLANKTSGKTYLKTLLHQLAFFSKIKNPKSLYREPELYKLYLDLLSHRNAEVQKAALDCIMVYKHKYLVPYKDNLYSLIDEKKFKHELSAFRIDKDTNIVQEVHREELIPIVLRIVFSKMVTKTGMRTGGKSAGQMRRNLILRFLAGCQENEMMKFLNMIFKYYGKFFTDDPVEMVQTISNDVDLEKCISPKRLQSTLNLLSVILDQFGGLMSQDILNYIMKILLVIGATIDGVLKQRANIHSGYLSSLKNLRSSSMGVLKRFFDQFETYAWSNKEINAFFNVFIWPWLNKLPTENVHSPTPMLKLLYTWSMNPRYFILLVKHNSENTEEYALSQIINLLMTDKLHPSVSSMIMEMLEKLLLLKPNEEEKIPALKVDNVIPIAKNILERLTLNEKLNYGSCILLPFIPSVLLKLKKKLLNKNKGINSRESFILSRISELVWEPEICDTVLGLLLPIITKKASSGAGEETLTQLVTTVNNLMKTITQPEKHIRKLAPLFCEINSTGARKILCEILNIMDTKCKAELSEKMTMISKIIVELNAFDARWLDQPDFEKRLNSFKQISNLVEDDNLELDLGVILVFNCFYFIKNEKDLALRESAGLCLRNIIPYLVKKYDSNSKDKAYLLNEILLDMIRRGITNKNEHYRHEAISILGHMARECSEAHTTLSDLSKLSNKVDMEVDFFENILHLQLYRQTRALNKFNQIYQELKVAPNVRTLTQFILPLTSAYLLTEKFATKNSLIDNSIESLKTICRLLPWHQYESVLKFYLGKLRYKREFQKQLVRIVVAILDAYHFDLSKTDSNYVKEDMKPIKQKETVIEKEEVKEKKDESKDETVEKEETIDEIFANTMDVEEYKDEDSDEEEIQVDILPINRQNLLCPSAAKRVVHSIQNVLLPQLHKTMAELTQHESSHKVNRKKTGIEREEEELQKIPISLAVVKLLQRLPVRILEHNLPGILMKLCSFFKSHLESVRRTTRETLQKIMTSLGPKYLGLLISEMSSMLSRGFQIHVLVYSVHSVLVCLKDSFKPYDIDKCLLTILELCKADLFGSLSEEKDIAKIGSKVSEAKATKSFDTFQILAQFITEKCLMDLLLPLKEVLSQTHSFKIVNKAQESLRRIVLGLVDNTFITTNSLLVFAYGTASESIPQFIAKHTKKSMTAEEREKKAREKQDCFIIPKGPVGRSGVRKNTVCSSAETNSHLLVEFGLRLCYFLLKREKVQDENLLSFLDPFVIVFKNCLASRHVKMCTLTLQCLGWVVKYEIPSMKENIKDITKSIFELLHKYAAAGLSKGDNFDLVVAAFKTMAILVRDVKYYTIETEQLKALLLYAEQDLHDFERQATAFALLKSIIARKLIIPQIHDVMHKVSELSITSDLPHIRLQCRQVFHQFLMDYPLGKKLDKHLSFYMSQLNYDLRPGRESALEMIQSVIITFPLGVLKKQAGLFFVMLGARLVNDEAPECRKMVAKALQTMLERLEKPDRDSLFDIVKSWFKDKKISHRRLAAQLCGIIVMVEKINFEKRIPEIMPDIIAQFTGNFDDGPGKFVKLVPARQIEDEEEEKNVKPQDHHLFQVLQMLLKICAHCPSVLENVDDIETLSVHIQSLLAYPHEWVRLAAAQFIGYVLSVLDINHLAELLSNKTCDGKGYLYSSPQDSVKSLTLDLCDQLQPGTIKSELAEQVVKNLVFMARVLQNVPMEETVEKTINLYWLTRRMRKIVNLEIVQASKSTILRTEVFKWIAGVITTLEADKIRKVLHNLLAPLVREMITTEQSNAPLRQLAKEVGGILKKKVGHEEYITNMSNLQMQLNVRRAERKRERTQLAITDPEAAAKKKIKMHDKKKEAKKRKIENFKGKKPIKKKRENVDLDSSEVM